MYQITLNDNFKFTADRNKAGLIINDTPIDADITALGGSRYHVIHNNQSYEVEVTEFNSAEKSAVIKINGNEYLLTAKDQFDALLELLGMGNLTAGAVADLKAPMPGLVLKVFVKENDEVQKGDNLFVLEAMKMENIIKAPAQAIVKTVKIKPGDKVEKGQILIGF